MGSHSYLSLRPSDTATIRIVAVRETRRGQREDEGGAEEGELTRKAEEK